MIQVEYIESSGTQWIDTGYKPKPTTKLICRVNVTQTGRTPTVFGTRSSYPPNDGFAIFARRENVNGYYVEYAGMADVLIPNSQSEYGQPVTIRLGDGLASVEEYTLALTGSPTCAYNLYLFTLMTGGADAGAITHAVMQLYDMQIYEGETLVHDYVAALDENEVACLYDTVADAYLYNAGTGVFTAGDPVQQSFTVAFDAAGGEGSMPNQQIVVDTPTALTACTFTREDYMFSGWATEQGGPAVYADGETVENLAESGETVTLYAVWTAAPLSIVLQYNASDRDHLDKELEDVRTLYGVFQEECEITDPVILLEGDPSMLQGVNYFTVRALGRSYYLTGCRVIRSNLLEIAGHVDVLSSFKDAIREQTAIVRRAESDQAYNLYLNDGSLHVYADPYILTEPFPAGFTSPSFILAVAGSAGS